VGAGVAGLTLAYKLLKSGISYPVVVVEKEDRVGGLARSFTYTDAHGGVFIFDIGPHRFHSEDKTVIDFILEILGDDHIEIGRASSVWMYDHYHPWPLKINTVFRLPFWLMVKSTVDLLRRKKAKTESFEDYIIEKYGKSLYLVFFKPYTHKFLKFDCSHLHADWAKTGINRAVIDKRVKANSLIDIIRSTLIPKQVDTKFIYPKSGGNDVFCQYLEQRIKRLGGRVLVSSTVTAIEAINNSVNSVVVNNSEEIKIKHLFWSAPIPLLLKLLNIDNNLPRLEYLALVLANYLIDAPPAQMFQWCYFGTDKAPVSRIAIPTMFNPNLAPEGKSGLCVELTCLEGDNIWNHPERTDVIIEEFLEKAKLIARIDDIIDVKFERIPNSYPIYTLNYPRKLNLVSKTLNDYKNLLNFGRTGGFWYNNQDHSIAQALSIATSYMQNPETFDPALFKFERDFTRG
jgi:protoporphyrinogen oxidase